MASASSRFTSKQYFPDFARPDSYAYLILDLKMTGLEAGSPEVEFAEDFNADDLSRRATQNLISSKCDPEGRN